jgi:hypothetical protein
LVFGDQLRLEGAQSRLFGNMNTSTSNPSITWYGCSMGRL